MRSIETSWWMHHASTVLSITCKEFQLNPMSHTCALTAAGATQGKEQGKAHPNYSDEK